MKVLNNAYQNGVPNEVLLNFLSNPVTQNATSVKATVNVYRPFTWILLLEIVSLFTAYLFATQNVIRKVKDKFKLDKLHDTDLMTVTHPICFKSRCRIGSWCCIKCSATGWP